MKCLAASGNDAACGPINKKAVEDTDDLHGFLFSY
jgi:hypothetical protein